MSKHITVDTEPHQVHFTKTSPVHACCELSDLTRDGRPDTITIRKKDRNRSWVFTYIGTKRDSEGEAEEFSYRCASPRDHADFSLTVFND